MKLITVPSHEALSYVIQKYGDHHRDGYIKGWFGYTSQIDYIVDDGEPVLRLFGLNEDEALTFIEETEFLEAMAKL